MNRFRFALTFLAFCVIGAAALFLAGSAKADASDCHQAMARVSYAYADDATVPDGAASYGATAGYATSGADAGQPGCESSVSPMEVRMSTLTDPAVTNAVTFSYAPVARADAAQCTGTLFDQDGQPLQTVTMDPVDDTDPATSTVYGTATLDPSVVSSLPLDTPVTFTTEVTCPQGSWSPQVTVTAVHEPDSTEVTMNRSTVASKAVSQVTGHLVAQSHGTVAGQKVVVQAQTKHGWVRVGKTFTGKHGHYAVRVSSNHHLRARFPATLRLWGSHSKVR